MSALYRLEADRERLERLLAIGWPKQIPDGDRRPTDPVLAVDRTGTPRLFRWGLVPSWAKDPNAGKALFNARAETAPDKPSFRTAFRKRRCFLPATEFYEWREEPAAYSSAQPELFDDAPRPGRAAPKRMRRYRFTTDERIFAMAGLWETWHSDDGSELDTCTVLTTESNAIVLPYNERMPCILQPEDIERWLDPKLQSVEALQALLGGLRTEQTRVESAE